MSIIIKLIILVLAVTAFPFQLNAEGGEWKKFSPPDLTSGKPLMQALSMRHAAREFSSDPLPDKTLGNMLWAAFGINRPDGRRTAPTARNVRDIDIYVLLPDGVWLYVAEEHALKKINGQDVRKAASFAPVVLLYVADRQKGHSELSAAMHVGSIYQNVGLFCASAGLNNVVALRFDAEALNSSLNLPKYKNIIISQSVGKPPSSGSR